MMTDTGDPPPADTSHNGHQSDDVQSFRFFDLPRELRDWCYDYMTGPTKLLDIMLEKPFYDSDRRHDSNSDTAKFVSITRSHLALKIAVGAPPLASVFRVNRQMKLEYDQRANNLEQTRMIIYDHERNQQFAEFDPSEVNVPHFDWAKHADYFGVLRCEQFQCGGDVESTAGWIRSTVGKLSKLKSMHVYLAVQVEPVEGSCEWQPFSEFYTLQHELQEIADIDAVKQLHLFRGERRACELREIPSDDLLYISWSESGGWVMPDPAENSVDARGVNEVGQ